MSDPTIFKPFTYGKKYKGTPHSASTQMKVPVFTERDVVIKQNSLPNYDMFTGSGITLASGLYGFEQAEYSAEEREVTLNIGLTSVKREDIATND